MKLQGKVWKFGDNVDTDLIIPARFLNVSDKDELARNCFADLRPDFINTIRPGDVIVAGENFGCGSSREHAPLAIKSAGISGIIAKSFARIFYRNAFNIGLPILECKEASASIEEGNRVSVNLATGEIVNLDTGEEFFGRPSPEFMRERVEA
ncbi:MAG: 3-isopropylmalate dehydratase small subunit, partial [Desulfatiglandales bacterium]